MITRFLLLLLLLIPSPGFAHDGEPCGSATVDLLAGQTIPAGTVTVANDDQFLYVVYSTTGDWRLTETHLAVGCALDEIPQTKKGNPIPGRFPLSTTYDPPALGDVYVIPLDALDCDEVFIAAHASVVRLGPDGDVVQEETGWADGDDFPGRNWATWFRYTIQPCEDDDDGGGFRTQTQGGWGAPAHGDNPGAYRDANFAAAFPTGLTIGAGAGHTVLLTSAGAVETLLPQGGPPAPLSASAVDPADLGTVLAGQVTALSLSVGFDLNDPEFSASATPLAALVVADPSSDCFGWTVAEVLDEGNLILSGQPSSLSPAEINECLSRINENFVDGTTDGGFLALP